MYVPYSHTNLCMNTAIAPYFGHTFIQTRILRAAATDARDGFVVVGARLTGKSALLHHLAASLTAPARGEEHGGAPRPLALYVDCAQYQSHAAFWRALAAVFAGRAPAGPTENLAGPYDHLMQMLAAAGKPARRLTILLDNVDHLLLQVAQPALLCAQLCQLAAHALLVLSTQHPLYNLSTAVADSVFCSAMTHLFLGLLEQEAATAWLAHHLECLGAALDIDAKMRDALLAFTGRHPFLLHRLGDCLAETLPMLSAPPTLGQPLLPFLRLRLAEHGRPLFRAQRNLFLAPPPHVARGALLWLLDHMRHSPVRLDTLAPDRQSALNWLINQAVAAADADDKEITYRLYSPLLADFLAQAPGDIHTDEQSAAQLSATVRQDVETWPLYDKLTKIEASLLRYLQQHSRKIVSTEQLLADVWKRPNASSRRVQEAIRRLRLQLEQQQPPVGEIKNERGRGYRFVPA